MRVGEYELIIYDLENGFSVRCDARVKVFKNDKLVFDGELREIVEIDTSDYNNGEDYYYDEEGIYNEVEREFWHSVVERAEKVKGKYFIEW